MSEQAGERFDVAVCEKIKACFAEVFTRHPEVRSLSAAIDWSGSLNDADIMHGVWLGPGGVVGEPDAVYGSVMQTLRLLDNQTGRAMKLNQHLRDQCQVLGEEVVRRGEEIQRLDREIKERKQALQNAQGAGDAGADAEAAQGPG